MRIRNKLIVTIVPVFLLIIIIAYLGSANTATSILDREVRERISTQEAIQKSYIERNMELAGQIAQDVQALVSETYQNESLQNYENILQTIVRKNDFILGVGIWFEPYLFDQGEKYVGPYIYKKNGTVTTTYDYSNEEYDYFNQYYYSQAKERGELVFTDIYYDQTSELYMMTCSLPMIDVDRKFLGCITVDVSLDAMQNFVEDYNEQNSGSTYIVNNKGVYLASREAALVKEKNDLFDTENSSFHKVAKQILSNENGEVYYIEGRERINVYFDTLNELDWKIVFEIPEAEIHKPLQVLLVLFAMIFAVSLFLLLFAIYLITNRSIKKPVQLLVKELDALRGDSFHGKMNEELLTRKDEFGAIGKSLQEMKNQLQQYQQDLQESLEENIAANEELSQQNEELFENERLISDSLQYSNSLIEAFPDPVFVISREGVLLDCQGDSKSLFFSREHFLGKKIVDVLPPEIAKQAMEAIQEALLTGNMQKIEYQWSRDQQTEFYELHVAQWYDEKLIAITRNITESGNYIREIEYANFHDQLTGLFNRSYFDKKSKELIKTENHPISIIISGLNGLKMINDSFGHAQGDAMIQKYADILRETIGQDQLNCRISGDEFVAILLHTDEEKIKQLIMTVMRKCSEERVNNVDLSVAFGYAVIDEDNFSFQKAMKIAEDHMYQNKLYASSSRRSETIDIILSTLHEKNKREEKHSRRVAELCAEMAQKMCFGDEEERKLKLQEFYMILAKLGLKKVC